MTDFDTIKEKVKHGEATKAEKRWYNFSTATVVIVMLLVVALPAFMIWQSG